MRREWLEALFEDAEQFGGTLDDALMEMLLDPDAGDETYERLEECARKWGEIAEELRKVREEG